VPNDKHRIQNAGLKKHRTSRLYDAPFIGFSADVSETLYSTEEFCSFRHVADEYTRFIFHCFRDDKNDAVAPFIA